jgi:hypothetical protein
VCCERKEKQPVLTGGADGYNITAVTNSNEAFQAQSMHDKHGRKAPIYSSSFVELNFQATFLSVECNEIGPYVHRTKRN